MSIKQEVLTMFKEFGFGSGHMFASLIKSSTADRQFRVIKAEKKYPEIWVPSKRGGMYKLSFYDKKDLKKYLKKNGDNVVFELKKKIGGYKIDVKAEFLDTTINKILKDA